MYVYLQGWFVSGCFNPGCSTLLSQAHTARSAAVAALRRTAAESHKLPPETRRRERTSPQNGGPYCCKWMKINGFLTGYITQPTYGEKNVEMSGGVKEK